jgi:hypothetical protein
LIVTAAEWEEIQRAGRAAKGEATPEFEAVVRRIFHSDLGSEKNGRPK